MAGSSHRDDELAVRFTATVWIAVIDNWLITLPHPTAAAGIQTVVDYDANAAKTPISARRSTRDRRRTPRAGGAPTDAADEEAGEVAEACATPLEACEPAMPRSPHARQ
ncbi:hypothetical protein [Streptomyces sp. NPDC059176]|uniref:hypothetical protein n=1 Tax=unclassified Streptomyces TaxID=2593676 RepID=UPI0036CC0228